MSDNFQHIDVDDDEYIDAPKALRDHVKKLQSALTKSNERLTELTGQVTATALTDVLAGYKNPERVKRDLLSDKVDPLNSGAVQQWLQQNGDDYAKGEAGSAPKSDPELEAEAAAHQQLANAGAGLRQPADMSKVQAVQTELTKEMTGSDVIALIAKQGL